MSVARIRPGLAAGHRAAALSLYWLAFGPKLGRLLGPETRALAYLDQVLCPEQMISAVSERGELLGIAGFRMARGAVSIGRLPEMVSVYGRFGAFWRCALIRALPQAVGPGQFSVDGLAVFDAARGQGIGAALIEALCTEARRHGFREILLDVADANTPARALYEREGFVPCGRDRMGPLRLIFGFSASTRMVRHLA